VPLVLLSAIFLFFILLMAVKYNDLYTMAEQACADTGAAAKLDLSGFVPLCKAVRS
jgi:hypothetical protein